MLLLFSRWKIVFVINLFGCGPGLLRALAGQARPRWEVTGIFIACLMKI